MYVDEFKRKEEAYKLWRSKSRNILDIDCYRRVVKHLVKANARGYNMSHLYRRVVVFIIVIIFVLQMLPLSISIAEEFSPDLAVKMFIESYSIPDFVKNSIDPTLPDVLRDGILLSYIITSEGIVLLKNNGALPLKPHEKIAVFGVAQHWAWYYHGGGSAYTIVPSKRVITLLEKMKENLNMLKEKAKTLGITDEELKKYVDIFRENVDRRIVYRYR